METKEKKMLVQRTKRMAGLFVAVLTILCSLQMTVFAESGKTEVTGKVYEFEKDSHYEFHDGGKPKETGNGNTYGIFCISGNITSVSEKNDVPSYEVSDGNLKFYYNHGDTMLHALRLCTGVVVTISFQQLDNAPNAETCTESDNESLKNTNSRVKKFHR